MKAVIRGTSQIKLKDKLSKGIQGNMAVEGPESLHFHVDFNSHSGPGWPQKEC